MTHAPILYSFRRCPYAMRARMAIRVSGVQVELREVVLRDKPPELRAVSAKATVPVLCLPDGRVLDESLDIMRWALAIADPHGWLSADQPGTESLIARNDGPFKGDLDRYKYGTRFPGTDTEAHRDAGVAWLTELNARLAERLDGRLDGGLTERRALPPSATGPTGLLADTLTLADVALAPFIRQFANTDRAYFDALPLPHLQRWLATILAAPVFTEVMGKVPQWAAGQASIHFP